MFDQNKLEIFQGSYRDRVHEISVFYNSLKNKRRQIFFRAFLSFRGSIMKNSVTDFFEDLFTVVNSNDDGESQGKDEEIHG